MSSIGQGWQLIQPNLAQPHDLDSVPQSKPISQIWEQLSLQRLALAWS
jgi:hypothetical protein